MCKKNLDLLRQYFSYQILNPSPLSEQIHNHATSCDGNNIINVLLCIYFIELQVKISQAQNFKILILIFTLIYSIKHTCLKVCLMYYLHCNKRKSQLIRKIKNKCSCLVDKSLNTY